MYPLVLDLAQSHIRRHKHDIRSLQQYEFLEVVTLTITSKQKSVLYKKKKKEFNF